MLRLTIRVTGRRWGQEGNVTLRIQFSGADLAHTAFAEAPDPLWEVLLSLHALQTEHGGPGIQRWRAEVVVDRQIRRLFALAPSRGYSPDFLTPDEGASGFAAGVDALLRTPPARLRQELALLIGPGRAPEWARVLAAGGAALRELGQALTRYHHSVVRPYWSLIERQVLRDRADRARMLATKGLGRTLESLHPQLRWHGSELEISGRHVSGELRLDGRGIRIVPSFFCHGATTVLFDASLPPVLVYPVEHGPVPADASLDALLGTTRARILAAAAAGCTMTELSGRVDISAAATSYHTTILADAGLIDKRRIGNRVVHTVTPLGQDLLTATGAQQVSG